MKKRVFKEQLAKTSRNKYVFRNLIKDLFDHGVVNTTLAKAKSLKNSVDKLLASVKVGDLATTRLLAKKVGDFVLAQKMVDYSLKHSKKSGHSGYVSLERVKVRRGDGSVIARVALIFGDVKTLKTKAKETNKKVKLEKNA